MGETESKAGRAGEPSAGGSGAEPPSSIVRMIPVALGLSVERTLVEISDELCRMTGYSRDELQGRTARILYATEEEFHRVRAEAERQVAAQGTAAVETRWQRKSGDVVAVLLRASPIDPADFSKGVAFAALDITDLQRTSDELREEQERYRDLFENANDQILYIDKWGTILEVNGRNKEIFGLESAEIVGKHLTTLVKYTRLSIPNAIDLFKQVFSESGPLRGLELECVRADDGRPVHVELNIRVIRKRGRLVGMLVNVRDITDRKRASGALAESEAKFRSVVESSPMGIHLYSLEGDGRLVFRGANPAAERILGLGHAAFVGRTVEEAFPGLVGTEIPARYRAIAAQGGLFTTSQVDYAHGAIVGAFEVYAFQTSPGRMAAMFLDVAARLRAEEALRRKTAELDRFFSSTLDLLCIADTAGYFRRLNPEWEKTLGYQLDELVGKRFLDYVHPDDLAATEETVAVLADQEIVLSFVNRYRHKDGSYRWLEWRSFPAGELIYAAARDVTERKAAERALLESERLNRMIAEMASDYVFHISVGPGGQAVMDYVSQSFSEITGRTLEQAAHIEQWGDFIHADDVARLRAGLRSVIVTKQPFELECRTLAKGAHRWVKAYARPELDTVTGHVVGIIGAVKDVTANKRLEEEQRKLQEQLQQAMKMEAIGRLAGGVAHDFNNLLTSILGNVELELAGLNASDPLAVSLREVSAAAQSAAALTRQLLAFSRKQILEPRVLSLNDLVENLQKMLQRLIGEDVTLRFAPGPELWPVRIDPSQFEQVIANLAVNARDAMPTGGTLVIETANVDLDADAGAQRSGLRPGAYVTLSVSDTGVGMSRDIQEHLFEPFFTTKPKGKGTGLGLATIYGAVSQAGGAITVVSEPGGGSTFTIYLPRAHEKPEKWTRERLTRRLPTGTETVLLVEDDPSVRGLAQKILARLGYRVLPAVGGAEAVALAEQTTERIDLLLTDVVMPEMSGRDVADRLAELHPEAKVLYTSGYTDDVVVHHGVVDQGVHFIAKPYTADGLARKLRDVLGWKG